MPWTYPDFSPLRLPPTCHYLPDPLPFGIVFLPAKPHLVPARSLPPRSTTQPHYSFTDSFSTRTGFPFIVRTPFIHLYLIPILRILIE